MKALSKLFGSALVLSLAFGSLVSANTGEDLNHGRKGNGPRVPLAVIAEAFSIDVDTLIAEFKSGSTLKEIATNHGISEESFAQILQELKDKKADHPKEHKHFILKNLSDDARAYMASLLGVTVEDLEQAREDGVSFKSLVESHGMTVKEVFAKLKEYKESQEGEVTQQ